MKTSKQKVILNSIIYIISNMAIKGLSFILLPLYTTRLSAQEYGLTGLISNFISLAIIIVSLDIQVAVSKFYVAYAEDENRVRRLVGTLYSLMFLTGTAFFVLSYILRNFIINMVFGDVDYYPVICITTITICLNCIYSINQSLFQIMQDAKREMLFNGILFISTFVFNYYFVAVRGSGVFGVAISSLLSYMLYIILSLLSLKKRRIISICFDRDILKDCLKYSIPLIPHNLAASATPLVSNVLIKDNYDISAVGSYTLASKFGVICDIIQGSINKAYTPYLFRCLKENNKSLNNEIKSITEMIIYINGFVFIGVSLFAKEVIQILANNNYPDVWKLVPFIVLIYIVKIPYHFYIGTLFYYPKTSKKIFIATIISATVNILLSYVLIPLFGIIGSIIADILAMAVRVVVILIIGIKNIPIKYSIATFAIPMSTIIAAIGLGMVSCLFLTDYTNEIIIISTKILIYIGYTLIVSFKYRKQFIEFGKRMRNRNE